MRNNNIDEMEFNMLASLVRSLTPYWKSFLAFVALVAANLLTQLTATGAVWPKTVSGWVSLVGTTAGGTLLVLLKGNTTSDPVVAASQSVTLKGKHEAG